MLSICDVNQIGLSITGVFGLCKCTYEEYGNNGYELRSPVI
jgi:hypothetical protein